MILPSGDFGVILADPPWRFKTRSDTRQHRSASQHYGLMDLDDICDLPVWRTGAKDCALMLWSLNSMQPEALKVINAWGFTYKTVGFTWVKLTCTGKFHTGLGYWSRQNTERCILAVRGKPKRISMGVKELIVAPRREHSRKPEEIYERIEAMLPGPYLELFARTTRPGWTSWGNEVGKFDKVAA
ncbi:MAG: MT-A70 family methyltransferase [Pseudorhodoplanes sp.]